MRSIKHACLEIAYFRDVSSHIIGLIAELLALSVLHMICHCHQAKGADMCTIDSLHGNVCQRTVKAQTADGSRRGNHT